MKIDFERPPINEVSIGMLFAPLLNLKAEHIGLFWSRVRAAFPNSQQMTPIGGVVHLPPEVFPMPRFWFIAKDDATLIQVQKNAFLFNWRLREKDYPRFESVFEAFRREGEHALSFNWMEYYWNCTPDEQLQLIRKTFSLKVNKKDRFAKLHVGSTKHHVRTEHPVRRKSLLHG